MCKKFKFVVFSIFLFILSVPSLNAVDDYLFDCDYELRNNSFDQTFSLRARIFKDGVKFYYGNKDFAESSLSDGLVSLSSLGFNGWTGNYQGFPYISYNLSDYFVAATKDGKYSCPSLLGPGQSINYNTGKKYPLIIGEASSSVKPLYNPNLDESEKNEIDNNTVKITTQCNPVSIYAHTYNDLPSDLQIKFYMDSDGKKWVELKFGTSNVQRAEFTSTVAPKFSVATGNVAGQRAQNTFQFYISDFNTIFKQTPAQVSNNTFTCPTGTPYIAVSKNQGQLGTLYGTNYIITYNKSTVNSESNGDSNEFVDKPLVDNPESGSNSSSIIGTNLSSCSQMLGSASTPGSVASLLDTIYTLIKVASIVLVIVLSMMDYVNATIKDKDILMDTVKKTCVRLVVLIIILLLPTLIDLLGNMFGQPDILCGIK